ncbi:DUF433 domain-containing protein [Limimaricola sp. G21655-S1]|uniref:DUF433 domain-containing protein n=1 Tax=Limimaricola sp. G21655-S1 TaxID=3014768 RepID=UPI0022AFF811|nr:DUF433 domain-containing protein [Limimaricola sp. G21655-S1]
MTGVDVKRIHRLIDDRLLPKKVCRIIEGRRMLPAYAAPMVCFGAGDGAKLGKELRLAAMRSLEKFARESLAVRPGATDSVDLAYDEGNIHIDLSPAIKASMEGLRRLEAANERIVSDPAIRGGLPTIRGTRIGGYEVAAMAKAHGAGEVLEAYPSLSAEDIDAAVIYSEAHPRAGRPRKVSPPGSRLRSVTKIALDP